MAYQTSPLIKRKLQVPHFFFSFWFTESVCWQVRYFLRLPDQRGYSPAQNPPAGLKKRRRRNLLLDREAFSKRVWVNKSTLKVDSRGKIGGEEGEEMERRWRWDDSPNYAGREIESQWRTVQWGSHGESGESPDLGCNYYHYYSPNLSLSNWLAWLFHGCFQKSSLSLSLSPHFSLRFRLTAWQMTRKLIKDIQINLRPQRMRRLQLKLWKTTADVSEKKPMSVFHRLISTGFQQPHVGVVVILLLGKTWYEAGWLNFLNNLTFTNNQQKSNWC